VFYTAEDIDVLAAHIVPLDVWYVVPVGALAQGSSLRLYPDDGCRTARFEKYREAWHVFRGEETEEKEALTVVDDEPGDDAIPLCFSRWRPVWKPRFMGR
jgi:hypothetical protein